jgi:hypothetical protein
MAGSGYSGTPLATKLGIKPDHRVALIGAPDTLADDLAPLPDGVTPVTRLSKTHDVIVAFFDRRAALEKRFPALQKALDPSGGLWIAWPKTASKVPTDITEDVVREIALAAGLVDNKVCAIDAIWSGLRVVVRVKDRPRR